MATATLSLLSSMLISIWMVKRNKLSKSLRKKSPPPKKNHFSRTLTGKSFKNRNSWVGMPPSLPFALWIIEVFTKRPFGWIVGGSVKQVPECCYALANRKTPTGQALQQALSVMVTSRVLQNSSALSGRTLRQSGRFNAEPCPALLLSPSTGNWLYLGKVRPLLSHQNMKDGKLWALPAQAGWRILESEFRGLVSVIHLWKM